MKKTYLFVFLAVFLLIPVLSVSAQIYEIDSFVNKYAKAYDELVANTYKERADINYKDEYIEIPNGTEVTVKRIIPNKVDQLPNYLRFNAEIVYEGQTKYIYAWNLKFSDKNPEGTKDILKNYNMSPNMIRLDDKETGTKKVYNACGAEYESLKLDERGISAESLENTKAKVLHVTPFKSYPTGITVSASKRFEYLKWAEKNGGFIIEDDFASEFSVNSKPVETIYSMDKDGRVIYVNTFSKSLAPSMRMGYMILPEQLAERYKERLGFYSCSVPVFDQYVLAEFINSGCFERHLNRMRRKIRQLKKIY